MLAVRRSVDEVIIYFDRFDTRKSHSPVAGDSVELFKEMLQSKRRQPRLSAGRVDPVVPDMNPGKDDFAVAVVDQPSDFCFDRLGCAALQTRSNLRNNAVSTVKDAAVLNLHVRTSPTVEMADPVRDVDDAQPVEYVG